MSMPRIAPYGTWQSPITAAHVAAGTMGVGQIACDGADVYWVETRPQEGGRWVVVRLSPDGRRSDVTPAGFNARTRVHEYGGRGYVVDRGTVYFANFADQRLYRQDPGMAPLPITPERPLRYADPIVDLPRGRLICVREDHTDPSRQAVNTIVGVDPAGDAEGGRVLVAGNDFYAAPRLSPDGTRLAWLAWNHPNMPWDGTGLWVGRVGANGALGEARQIAGGAGESIFQPEWSADGTLCFVSDRTGWWNLYRMRDGQAEALCPMPAEFGQPQWGFGMSTYAFASRDRIVCACTQDGTWRLATLDMRTLAFEPIALPYTEISGVQAASGHALFRAGAPQEAAAIVRLDLVSGRCEVLRRSGDGTFDAGHLSLPQPIAYPTADGLTAYALFYPPRNDDHAAPAGEKPPLLVISHGGPTGAAATTLDLEIQFWTSRGFAVLDVNYGGSTGYGRAYRERLNGAWGIVDVADCADGARHLVAQGLVDGKRLIIRGGSAGGYTTLCALTFTALFAAGASYYGVSDLETLARDTHKFESRYLDRLVGPYPERRDLYIARSPIYFTDRLACPIIFFQGEDDPVVPPDQTELMFVAVRSRGLQTAYLSFAGEQHGFRQARNIQRSLEAELAFYAAVFGFELGDPIEPLHIENLQRG